MTRARRPAPVVDRERWQRVRESARQLCATDQVPALALGAVRDGRTTGVETYGRQRIDPASLPLRDDGIFLIASLTKPIVAMATLLLVERGQLALADRAVEFIPEFDGADKKTITIRHLLSHTSGLPDMLPNNRALRMSRSPLEAFVRGTCGVTLDFPPGRGVQYQSKGYALLGEIIHRVSGVPCAEFLRREVFEPLGMRDTALGTPADWWERQDGLEPKVARIVEIRVPPEQEGGDDWNWNSRYWRSLGSPGGGLLSTPHDLLIFCRMMLRGGTYAGVRLFSPATVEAATSNQLDCLPDLPESDRRSRAWGFGWRLNWAAHGSCFGDLLSSRAYGHWGATGTLFWIDPARDAAAVILTTQPMTRDAPHLTRLTNMIVAAMG